MDGGGSDLDKATLDRLTELKLKVLQAKVEARKRGQYIPEPIAPPGSYETLSPQEQVALIAQRAGLSGGGPSPFQGSLERVAAEMERVAEALDDHAAFVSERNKHKTLERESEDLKQWREKTNKKKEEPVDGGAASGSTTTSVVVKKKVGSRVVTRTTDEEEAERKRLREEAEVLRLQQLEAARQKRLAIQARSQGGAGRGPSLRRFKGAALAVLFLVAVVRLVLTKRARRRGKGEASTSSGAGAVPAVAPLSEADALPMAIVFGRTFEGVLNKIVTDDSLIIDVTEPRNPTPKVAQQIRESVEIARSALEEIVNSMCTLQLEQIPLGSKQNLFLLLKNHAQVPPDVLWASEKTVVNFNKQGLIVDWSSSSRRHVLLNFIITREVILKLLVNPVAFGFGEPGQSQELPEVVGGNLRMLATLLYEVVRIAIGEKGKPIVSEQV